VNELGADTVRAYMMFLGPGTGRRMVRYRHQRRRQMAEPCLNIVLEEYEPKTSDAQAAKELERFTHQTIRKRPAIWTACA